MKKRYDSLDVLRGLTVAFMCVVNNPGSWEHIFPPLEHAGWTGCTPTDLVYPFFVFCMGCAMAFSFTKYETVSAKAYLRVLKRGALVFLVGLALNLYPFFPVSPHDQSWSFGQNYLYWLEHKRIFGVLQRIGMAYIIAGCLALWLRKPWKILSAIVTICVAYTGILLVFGTDPGAFTLEGNVSMRIDRWVVGSNHCYHGYNGTDFDPEGLLGSLMSACSCLLGYLAGSIIVQSRNEMNLAVSNDTQKASQASGDSLETARLKNSPDRVVNKLFVYGCFSLIGAMIISIWIPVSKPLWSASYVFFAGGWALLSLAFLAFVIDIKGMVKPFIPFKAMGMNALMAFVFAGLISRTFSIFGFSPSVLFGANEWTSLLYALLFASVVFCLEWILYKKNIVIKL